MCPKQQQKKNLLLNPNHLQNDSTLLRAFKKVRCSSEGRKRCDQVAPRNTLSMAIGSSLDLEKRSCQ